MQLQALKKVSFKEMAVNSQSPDLKTTFLLATLTQSQRNIIPTEVLFQVAHERIACVT